MVQAETTGGYTANAQRAAASAKHCGGSGCPSCVKAGLPVLLVRPGLAEKSYADAHKGVITPLLPGVADPVLTSSGYVMRTLRRGYLYAYYELWHTDEIVKQRGWQVFRVDDGGYLTPVPLEAVGTPAAEFACQRSESYATAMLFVIPNAQKTKRVWVGFTSSPWSKDVRRLYSSNPKRRDARMVCINAPDGTAQRSVPLTADNIVQCVADYDPKLTATALKGNPFPRRIPAKAGDMSGANAKRLPTAKDGLSPSRLFPLPRPKDAKIRPEDAALVHKQAQELIARIPAKPYKDENLLIVSVPDAEGVTTEAAQRRITLCNTAAEWAADPEYKEKLQSAMQIEGMYKLIEQNGEAHKKRNSEYAKWNGKQITRDDYEAKKKNGQLPEDAWFEPVIIRRGIQYTYDDKLVTVHIPGDWEINRQTKNALERFEEGLQKQGSAPAYREFLDRYKARQDADNTRLTLVEKDYKAWLQSDARKLVTSCDFDEKDQVDGVYYCRCVANITLGGPISDEATKWFKPFLGEDPTDKEALFTRALLGNQADFFKWFNDLNQQSKTYDEIKGVLSLDPVKKGLAQTGESMAAEAKAAAQAVLQTTSAVITKLDALAAAGSKEVQALSERFHYQLKLLTMRIMADSGEHGTLMKVKVNLAEAVQIWHAMADEASRVLRQAKMPGELARVARQTGEAAGRKVESLILNAAVLIEANGSPKAGMALLDVYIWVSEEAKAGARQTAATVKEVAAGVRKYVLEPAEIYGTKAAAQLARALDFTALISTSRISMRELAGASASGVLSTGAGLLQALLIKEAWKNYEKGNEQERQAAALGMLSAGLGLSAAVLELGTQAMKLAGKELLEKGMERWAGFLAAGATAIDAAQSFINAHRSSGDGDAKAKAGYRVQGVLFFGAAVAFVGATVAATTVTGTVVGLSALALTGFGLVLVALGVIVGFIILLVKDRPVEKWAKKTQWGTADEKWGGLDREAQEANKVMLCAQVDFSYRWNTWGNLAAAVERTETGGLGADSVLPMTSEAWLRMVLPQKLRQRLLWTMQIYGVTGRQEVLVGRASYDGSGNVSQQGVTSVPGVVTKMEFKEEVKDEVSTLTLSSKLDMGKFPNALARVQVYVRDSLASAADALGGRLPIIDEELRN